jgi:alpha-L-fucosidase
MDTYYESLTGEPFKTTAVYPNRASEKDSLERDTDLVEGGSPEMLFFSREGLPLAKGYARIVYGDHGAYVEFLREQNRSKYERAEFL